MTSLSDYFRAQADWRRQKAEQYPEDERNAQSAAALDSLAEFVEPDESGEWEAGRAVLEALEPHLSESVQLGGDEARRAVARYGYGYGATSIVQHNEFLDELVTLCMVDAYEHAGEHDGDDWTETLYDFEIEAAVSDVHLPRRYFERRKGWTEAEGRQAVEEYSRIDARG